MTVGDERAAFLQQLRAAEPIERREGRNVTKANVAFYRLDEADVALKDYSERPLLVRNTLGRWLVRRETRAYLAAGGLAGLPEFFGRMGPYSLATARIDGRPLSERRNEILGAVVFDRIRDIIAALHEHGIALGDLHTRDVLVTDEGGVMVIDFATAWIMGPRPGRFRRFVFERLADQDWIALARMRERWTGEADPEGRVTTRGLRWYRRARRAKAWLDRIRGKRR